MKCTLCHQTAYRPRLRPVGWVCAACFNTDAGYKSPRRLRSAGQGSAADPACTCGHPFSQHPPSPLYSCGVPGCTCRVYARNWAQTGAP